MTIEIPSARELMNFFSVTCFLSSYLNWNFLSFIAFITNSVNHFFPKGGRNGRNGAGRGRIMDARCNFRSRSGKVTEHGGMKFDTVLEELRYLNGRVEDLQEVYHKE